MQTEDILLEKLRSLLSDHKDYAPQTGERLFDKRELQAID